ncbi:WGR domain-containing protein, predicted DNA-binding domain in MolR [Trichlorobacter thiogenes]|uniref:WGR domain-containing protein, predicted DNA-binding domain in MolR n=1 Tax=Trichlorobacter thiogenes TaxID=115783 RepID=A0A1T4LLN8_9BACT|nr:WGR and DUF4132 domain-containing protein [Trichlorobacter thiogenes]SJZ55625.1 WGR domain-containing protein, predicted DNA-binding domain in MolR [Trichlorobacter thiogenes]
MRRFEFSDDKSNKFWEIEQEGDNLNIRWGKIGTNGQSQTKGFDDAAKAAIAMTKLVSEKTGKGYKEVGVAADAAIGASAEKPVKQDAKQAKVVVAVSETIPAEQPLTEAVSVESQDAQADRAFNAMIEILAGDCSQIKECLTAPRLKRDYGISEPAAKQVLQRLCTAGLVWGYGGSYNVNQHGQSLAARIAGMSSASPATAEENQPTTANLPPWLANGTPLRILPELLCNTIPTRRFPCKPVEGDAQKIWFKLRNDLEQNVTFDINGSSADLQPAVAEMEERVKGRKTDGSLQADSILLASMKDNYRDEDSVKCSVINFLAAKGGVSYLIDVYLEAQQIATETEYKGSGRNCQSVKTFSRNVGSISTYSYYSPLTMGDHLIRAYLSSAPEDVYRECLDKAFKVLPGLHTYRQALVALLFPSEPKLAEQVALEYNGAPPVPSVIHWLLLIVRSEKAVAVARKARPEAWLWDDNSVVATLLQERGIEALEILIPGATHDAAGQALSCIGLPESLEALARAASSSKPALARFAQAVERWPHAAMTAMAKVVSGGGKDAGLITPNLLSLLKAYPDMPQQLAPWLDSSSINVITRLQEQISGPKEVADFSELPELLITPPWLKKRKAALKPLALELLPLAAVEYWDEGEKELAQREDNKWVQQRIEECRDDLGKILKEIGLKDHNKSMVSVMKAAKDNDGKALAKIWIDNHNENKATHRYYYSSLNGLFVTLLPRKLAIEFWNSIIPEALKMGISVYSSDYVNASYGLETLSSLKALATSRPTEYLAEALHFGDTSFAATAARAFAKLKSMRSIGREWLLRFPEHAICGLLAASVGKACETRDCAASSLRLLAANGHAGLIMEKAGLYNQPEVSVAVAAMLDENPLDRFPSKIPTMPQFWQAESWSRPRLKNGKALPDSALQYLGNMLTFPTTEELYPGINIVKEACDAQSLADFGWDCFGSWLNAGAPAKEGWALTMLGYLGTDDTARKLTPYLRAWPGESAHARAVTGLDVLANIGSDVALMLLHGIAQKLKFKGLQDKAREKIDAIAEARGLTSEELEDRLAPDLGLDESGSLVLDFGPRQFKVGFDEALKPYVREFADGRDGGRLADLPKPKKTDDDALSKEAVERFKLLKKDARTIAGQQVVRLETAMCSRRRWSETVFRQFLAGHPLVRHLVQRLIWGVYQCEPESSYGGKLLTCFRVSEDGSYTNSDDDAITLPEGDNLLIGLPHALELPQEDAAAFGQLFADYELLQPFAQIGRDTYTISETELSGEKLERWKGTVVPTGRVLGLVNKGWRRGHAQDGGSIWYFNKPLTGDKVIELLLNPGIIVGMVDEYPEQTLQEIQVGIPSSWGELQKPEKLDLLDPISASELIRDMEALRG